MSIDIVVPEMGESVADARVARWLKNEGDAVAVGEALVELETDKVDVEVAAPKAGVLSKIAHQRGADVKIGDVLGTIQEGAAAASAAKTSAVPAPANGSAAPPNARPPATPSARKFAREENVDVGEVKSAGPRVTKSDVQK